MVQRHTALVSALIDRTRRELRARIDGDRPRFAMLGSLGRALQLPISRTCLAPLGSSFSDSIDRRGTIYKRIVDENHAPALSRTRYKGLGSKELRSTQRSDHKLCDSA
jgi:hypothetical protein